MRWIKIFSEPIEAHKRLAENKPQLIIVNGLRICLVKRENEIFAVNDFCTHNRESLSKGIVNYTGEIICPWHGYQFNLKNGRELNQRSADLETYPIREDKDGVYIALD
jgi:3-phenylpropionate/trans-cinnamate dioxygenase ferredoxin subunit